MKERFEPLLFERRLLEKVWGAQRLRGILGFELPNGKPIGESWELSDHPSGESRIRNGRFAGQTLREVMQQFGSEILGDAAPAAGGRFPLLVKFVDTSDRLSVQVHPDDAAAARLGERDGGKNEAWLVVHAEPDARLWVGPAEGKTLADLEAAANAAQVVACLREIRPRAGDVVPIPAGTVHAIGAGLTICEIQQTSDVTYRVYDWDRPASPARPLHRAQSFAVARFDRPASVVRPEVVAHGAGWRRCALPSPGSFSWELFESRVPLDVPLRGRCATAMVLAGEVNFGSGARARPGEAVLLPASMRAARLEPVLGRGFTSVWAVPHS
ncbi:MAG: class I mannose-6-phosphate isomerase [Planctomycetes bacterium]|nr:class I mannose-6-phosphate isomerase [Planctomycetota bacterium]